jgi:hypothetical protein
MSWCLERNLRDRLESGYEEVGMLFLLVGMIFAVLAVVASWGSDIHGQARFRLETVRPVGTSPRRGTTAA